MEAYEAARNVRCCGFHLRPQLKDIVKDVLPMLSAFFPFTMHTTAFVILACCHLVCELGQHGREISVFYDILSAPNIAQWWGFSGRKGRKGR